MDLLCKVAAKCRVVKVRIVQLWRSIPDCFRLLDWIMLTAGVNVSPQTRWQSVAWNLHQWSDVIRAVFDSSSHKKYIVEKYKNCSNGNAPLLGYSQMFLAFLGHVSALIWLDDIFAMFWSALISITSVHCLAKCYLLRRYGEEICILRSFLTAEEFSSGDSTFDNITWKHYHCKSRLLVIAIVLVMLFNQLVVWIPNEQQREIFYIPPWIGTYFGERLEFGLRIVYSSTYILFWAPKLAGCTIFSTVLLNGLKAEQTILNHQFEFLTDSVKDLLDFEITKEQFWSQLRHSLKATIDQQVLILSHLTNLQPMVEKVFFLTYYFALGAIGCTICLVLSVPFSFTNCGIMASLGVFSLEILQLGYQVESMADTFEITAGHAFTLCAQLPYSEDDHRKDYLELRTSLSIIGVCSRNVVRFGCAGISNISVAVFAELLNISYSVFTFLLKTI